MSVFETAKSRSDGLTRRQMVGLVGAAGAGLAVSPGLGGVEPAAAAPAAAVPAPPQDRRLQALKEEAIRAVNKRSKLVQEIVDSIFSFSELGFQEFQTKRYLLSILRKNGFSVQEGISGIPTAWMATWGSGGPVIALGSDIDGIPRSSQKPGVIGRNPLVEPIGFDHAPGHGEGHNSGMAAVIASAIVLKELMQRHNIKGTLKLWPGVAEELVGTKAFYVRDGYFDDVDVTLFAHVSSGLSVDWGAASGNGLLSLEYTFRGSPGHGASPHLGRSALDAVQLMTAGMEYRREHLPIQQRTHFVISEGGDQPNVIPEIAKVWYYLREDTADEIIALRALAEKIARGAAQMTDTELVNIQVLGAASPQHFNRPVAEAAAANMTLVGMPAWSEDDHTYARAVQKAAGSSNPRGLATEVAGLSGPIPNQYRQGGGSDDIGDITWKTPTITIRYPANIPSGGPSHTWWNALAMATPIAHKGTTTCAAVYATTVLELLLRPQLVQDAWEYFETEQAGRYKPLIGPDDKPAVHLNRERMELWRPRLEKLYYNPSRYKTYLDQLGISYPSGTSR
ncbi:amidohydrolase [Micromonospora sp. NPDC005367]|uniref:amidohydrolase n=1 Tax=Micromonospora sp. NPDC005367 TaxID=3155590 RepID=UPI0033B34920